jgi:hypothetical protein
MAKHAADGVLSMKWMTFHPTHNFWDNQKIREEYLSWNITLGTVESPTRLDPHWTKPP